MKRHTHVSIDYYAYASGLKEWNAGYKALLAMAALLLVVASDSIPLSVMTALFMGGHIMHPRQGKGRRLFSASADSGGVYFDRRACDFDSVWNGRG